MTTNEITVYERMSDPVAAIDSMGKSIAQSKLFGCQNEAQGQVLAMECMAQRMPPLTMAKRFDLMNGKLSMKSQAMLADFRTSGGKTRLVEKSANRAAIWMRDKDGNEYDFVLTWEETKEETFPYQGKEGDIVEALEGDRSKLKLKPKYSRPRSRAIMLWNRLISDSIRAIAPEINCGQYTPEEIEDFTNSPGNVVVADPDPVVEPAAALAIEAEDSNEMIGEAVDASFEVVEDSPKEASDTNKLTEAEFNSLPVNDLTVEQIKDVIKQAHQLGLTETSGKVKEKLIESGVGKLANLTQTDADRLLVALEKKLLGEWLSNPLAPVKNEGQAS